MINKPEYKSLIENLKASIDGDGSIQYAQFIRLSYDHLKYFLDRSFNLKEISRLLEKDLNLKIRYRSLWEAYNRYIKNIEKNKNNIIENIPEGGFQNKEKPRIENKKPVSDEIKDSEKNIELDWIKKPKFDHLNKKEIIETIIEYGITEQEVIDLNLPLYTLKCLDLLISYGEEKKAKEIGKLYFGN